MEFPRFPVVFEFHVGEHILLPVAISLVWTTAVEQFRSLVRDGAVADSVGTILSKHVGMELVVAILGILALSLHTTWRIWKLPASFAKNYFALLSQALYDASDYRHDRESGLQRLRDASYSINVITARTGKALRFMPDNKAVDLMHSVNGLISITGALPADWLNPTYNFFLVSNYLATLGNRLNMEVRAGPVSIRFASKGTEAFQKYKDAKKQALQRVANVTTMGELIELLRATPMTLRFYFLKKADLEHSESTFELLVAGHNLFGCYLYLVNEEQVDPRKKDADVWMQWRWFAEAMKYDFSNNKRLDFAVGVSDALTYLVREGDDLISRELTGVHAANFLATLRYLCTELYTHYDSSDYLLNNLAEQEPFAQNETFAHAYFESVRSQVPSGHAAPSAVSIGTADAGTNV